MCRLATGRFFTDDEVETGQKVVVLGSSLADRAVWHDDPVGQTINANNVQLTVIGVLAPQGLVSGDRF